MGRALLEAKIPPMWHVDGGAPATGADVTDAIVRFGQHTIPIREIAALRLEEVRESPAGGLFMTANLFLICAALLAYHVFEAGGRARFLIGTVFLGGLGVAALGEASRLRRLRRYELTFTLKDGRCIVFCGADRDDIQALALRVAAAGAALS